MTDQAQGEPLSQPVRSSRRRAAPWWDALVRLATSLVLMGALALLVGMDVGRYLLYQRGIASGLADAQPPLEQPRWGVNVSLERYTTDAALRQALGSLRDAGFGTLRQRFSWAELEPTPGQYRWERWDYVLPIVREYGLQVIAVLDTSPAWARPPEEVGNPWAAPAAPQDYARFARALAARYAGQFLAYQVWDQPNVSPHWRTDAVDPAGYVQLLRLSSAAIRQGDARARIIGGGLAPTLEPGGRALNDVEFLREIYRRGAGSAFDILGVRAYGFWTGPDDRRVRADALNFSRVILLREEMLRRGDAHKPVWALDAGWCALPANWKGRPSPTGSDTPFVQDARLQRALSRMQQEWPWMGLMCLLQWQPQAAADDPVWGYALLGADGAPQPALNVVRHALRENVALYPGLSIGLARDLGAPAPGGAQTLRFWGTDLALEIARGVAEGQLQISVDDQSLHATVDLADARAHVVLLGVAQSLAPQMHTLRLQGTPQQLATVQAARVGYRPAAEGFWAGVAAGALAWVWCALVARRAARAIPWHRPWGWARRGWESVPGWLQGAMLVLPCCALWLGPFALGRIAAFALYLVGALLRPDLALWVAVACIPLAPLTVRLGPGSFSLTEVSLLVACVAHLAGVVLQPPATARSSWPRRVAATLRSFRLLDWGVTLLVVLGFATSFLAEYQRVAWREWRVILCEPALLYLLLRTWRGPLPGRLRLVDVLWLSGVGVALYALARYPSSAGVIEAEGVRRARAFYGSPNNLALYLERLLPLGLALAAWGQTRWRRWAYGLGALLMLIVLALTFSRGAWLLGVPAAVLALAWVRGGRVRWVLLGALLLGVLLLWPVAGTARLTSLFNPAHGTTFIRVSLWQAAWDMLRDHPWLGVGLDNFLYYYGDYIRPGADVERWLSHPHNFILDFWLRLGVGGVVLILVLLGAFLRRTWRAYRSLPEGDLRAMTLGLMAGMAAFLAHGSIDSSFFVIELAYVFMFALSFCSPREVVLQA